jgi:light-regulated signal transduction histidine kinase (bacteriophytochrome)
VSVNGRPIRDAQGRIQGGVVVVRNISDQRRVEEKLKEYTRALETSNKELQDFVFVASHDLQEPLRKIQSFGEFLYDEFKGTLGETGRDYLERMRGAAGRMQTLINDLLALTRVTTKAQPFVSADLSQILKEVLADLEIRVEEKKAKVEVGPLPTLEADATQMRQLFQNLIANALKFQKNGTPPFVKVSAETAQNGRGPSERRCVIKVEDNGIGFDNKYGEQIFKVFERLHGRDEYEGTGIGLAICRKVVERHGGTIMAEGVVGKGSTFTITLPFQQKK